MGGGLKSKILMSVMSEWPLQLCSLFKCNHIKIIIKYQKNLILDQVQKNGAICIPAGETTKLHKNQNLHFKYYDIKAE